MGRILPKKSKRIHSYLGRNKGTTNRRKRP